MNQTTRRAQKRDERRALWGFLLRCAIGWTVAVIVLARVPALARMGIDLTVGAVAGAAGLVGVSVTRDGDTLLAGGQALRVVSDCSPHIPFAIFAGVVLAFPGTWWQRLVGWIGGALVIVAFNTVRIVTLILVIVRWPRAFEFVHVYLWQTGTILVLLGTFALWLSWLERLRRQAKPAAAPAGSLQSARAVE